MSEAWLDDSVLVVAGRACRGAVHARARGGGGATQNEVDFLLRVGVITRRHGTNGASGVNYNPSANAIVQ